MLLELKKRVYELDRPIAIEEIDPLEEKWVDDLFLHTTRLMLEEADAMQWFYHEANDCVRVCLWRAEPDPSGVWREYLPVHSSGGRKLLRDVRRNTHVRRRDGSRIWGFISVRWKGSPREVAVDSPHEWDVRLWRGAQQPTCLPYVLTFAELIPYAERVRGKFTSDSPTT